MNRAHGKGHQDESRPAEERRQEKGDVRKRNADTELPHVAVQGTEGGRMQRVTQELARKENEQVHPRATEQVGDGDYVDREEDHPRPAPAHVVKRAVAVEVREDVGEECDRLADEEDPEEPRAGNLRRERARHQRAETDPDEYRRQDHLAERHFAADGDREGRQYPRREGGKRRGDGHRVERCGLGFHRLGVVLRLVREHLAALLGKLQETPAEGPPVEPPLEFVE